MAKTKTPFLSFGSQGTVGQVVTSQQRRSSTLLREKPLPAYRYTLPQAYQRWLYEDYAYLWRQQSLPTRQTYATAGSRFHLTGFQYWMKYQLTNLPDIALWWKLDINTLPTTPDSGREDHTGLIVGASPSSLIINGALSFDGLNDQVSTPATGSLVDFTAKTVLLFYQSPPFTGTAQWLYYADYYESLSGDWMRLQAAANTIWMAFRTDILPLRAAGVPHVPDVTNCIGFTYDGTNVRLYHNGTQSGPALPLTGTLDCSGSPLYLARRFAGQFFAGDIDNLIIYRRALDATEMARWAQRRHPP